MGYGNLSTKELARLLGSDARQLERQAQRGEIPCQKVGGQFRFNQAQIHDWLQQTVTTMDGEGLSRMDAGITNHRRTSQDDMIVAPLLQNSGIAVQLDARTKNGVLRRLVGLAQESGLVYDDAALLQAVIEREQIASTAIAGGVAIPHPRCPQPYTIADSILVVASTGQQVVFGGAHGGATDLFCFIASQDSHHHLHLLARLCRMLQDKTFVQNMREATTVYELKTLVVERELELLS